VCQSCLVACHTNMYLRQFWITPVATCDPVTNSVMQQPSHPVHGMLVAWTWRDHTGGNVPTAGVRCADCNTGRTSPSLACRCHVMDMYAHYLVNTEVATGPVQGRSVPYNRISVFLSHFSLVYSPCSANKRLAPHRNRNLKCESLSPIFEKGEATHQHDMWARVHVSAVK